MKHISKTIFLLFICTFMISACGDNKAPAPAGTPAGDGTGDDKGDEPAATLNFNCEDGASFKVTYSGNETKGTAIVEDTYYEESTTLQCSGPSQYVGSGLDCQGGNQWYVIMVNDPQGWFAAVYEYGTFIDNLFCEPVDA